MNNDPIGKGVTLRDEIAMRVLPALIMVSGHNKPEPDSSAKKAYEFADELIKARGGPLSSRYKKR